MGKRIPAGNAESDGVSADKKHRLPPPVYKTVSESGPDHKKIYERGCYIGDELVAVIAS